MLIAYAAFFEFRLFVGIECTKARTFEILTFPSGNACGAQALRNAVVFEEKGVADGFNDGRIEQTNFNTYDSMRTGACGELIAGPNHDTPGRGRRGKAEAVTLGSSPSSRC